MHGGFKHVQAKLTEQEWRALKVMALNRGSTVSALLRELIQRYIAGRPLS